MLGWSDIRGQERALGVLENAVESGRVHHAYLFVGLEGVGKHATALALSRVLNCTNRPEDSFSEACGECISCRKIARGQHPDLHLLEPEGGATVKTIKIARVREIQKAAMTRPYEGRFQIVVLDDCHLMTEEAANALLKTLEEPPATMRLMLVTDQPHRLLDTIISRCQKVSFGALGMDDVTAIIEEKLADRELDDTDEEADEPPAPEMIDVAAGFGEGSVGRALRLLESGVLESRRDILSDLAWLQPSSPRALLDLAERLSDDSHGLNEQLDILKVFFRDVMIRRSTGESGRIINSDVTDLVESVADSMPLERVLDCIRRIAESQKLLLRNVNSRLVTEDLLLHLGAGVSDETIRPR